MSFAESKGVPVFITEWGSGTPGGSATQPAFNRQMQSFVTHNREFPCWQAGSRPGVSGIACARVYYMLARPPHGNQARG